MKKKFEDLKISAGLKIDLLFNNIDVKGKYIGKQTDSLSLKRTECLRLIILLRL